VEITSVIIFIRNIGMEPAHIDILDFIESGMTLAELGGSEFIGDVEIMQLKDSMANKFEFHGLVAVEPDSLGIKVIKGLNNTKLLEKPVTLREYVQRDKSNDPRLKYRPAAAINEQRLSDRRRDDLEILIEKNYEEIVVKQEN